MYASVEFTYSIKSELQFKEEFTNLRIISKYNSDIF